MESTAEEFWEYVTEGLLQIPIQTEGGIPGESFIGPNLTYVNLFNKIEIMQQEVNYLFLKYSRFVPKKSVNSAQSTNYSCNNGKCFEDPFGQYSTLERCKSKCGKRPEQEMFYSCNNGKCFEDPSGQYSTLAKCKSRCKSKSKSLSRSKSKSKPQHQPPPRPQHQPPHKKTRHQPPPPHPYKCLHAQSRCIRKPDGKFKDLQSCNSACKQKKAAEPNLVGSDRSVLEIPKDVKLTKKILMGKFRKLALKWHPDKVSRPENEIQYQANFQRINQAYQNLKRNLQGGSKTKSKKLTRKNIRRKK
jgi:hypothetical protein